MTNKTKKTDAHTFIDSNPDDAWLLLLPVLFRCRAGLATTWCNAPFPFTWDDGLVVVMRIVWWWWCGCGWGGNWFDWCCWIRPFVTDESKRKWKWIQKLWVARFAWLHDGDSRHQRLETVVAIQMPGFYSLCASLRDCSNHRTYVSHGSERPSNLQLSFRMKKVLISIF